MTNLQVWRLLHDSLVLVHPFIDETETISTRTLAMTRYRRNHDFMEEIFKQAAWGLFHSLSQDYYHLISM